MFHNKICVNNETDFFLKTNRKMYYNKQTFKFVFNFKI